MKKNLITFLLLLPYCLQGQQQYMNNNCDDCKLDCLCRSFFSAYLNNASLLDKIHTNWSEFFGEDLEPFFPAPRAVKSIALKFDGLGCIYPKSLGGIESIDSEFLDRNVKKHKFYKNSFYSIFQKEVIKNGNTITSDFVRKTGFHTEDFNKWGKNSAGRQEIEYFDFIKKWNEKYISESVNEINAALSNNTFKRIVVFVHGYNVPYSLAQLQGNLLIDSILSFEPSIQPKDLLFIRLFWPSGDSKKHVLDTTNCVYDNIEKYATVKHHTYYGNRAYLAAIATRKVLQLINTDLPIDIITHSFGSTVATTLMINTTSKLQRGALSDSIKSYMNIVPLPAKQISVFLNAPSIPGVMTFTDIDEQNPVYKKYFFFIGYNEHDITLKKQRLKVFGKTVRFIAPTGKLSSTTLGCNRRNEAWKTKALVDKKGLSKQFIAEKNSTHEEHEFYCYMKQVNFKDNLIWFLNRKN